MKTIRIILAIVMFVPLFSCNAQSSKKDVTTNSTDKIEAYYFHFTNRCVTCRTVESEAKADIENLYGGKITFQSINLDDASSKVLAEKLQVSGQTLLLVKGSQKIDITNEGFMYAVHQPEKLKAVIKEKIDGLN